mmetsp:Transcript_26479/g.40024  ORF Transcript_26479/g.40024 Transcript_26479/m.40024 type:complete len:301 (-) Transcript_26479:182-1084(-)
MSDDTMMCVSYSGDANLKKSDGGDFVLVRSCSDECHPDHQPQQETVCKETAAELRDEMLFKQPESSHEGDCPICCLPHSINSDEATLMSCCGKSICDGCDYANMSRETASNLHHVCLFCRQPRPTTKEDYNLHFEKRAAANDPVALKRIGMKRCDTGDFKGAFEYWTKAAELGEIISHFYLGLMYHLGNGLEKDEKKETYHMEQAAIGGHPEARFILGSDEWHYGSKERGTKHIVIAAKLGHDTAVKILREYVYAAGFISKEEFAEVLRAHQAALDAMKSPQREDAEKFKALMQEWERRE